MKASVDIGACIGCGACAKMAPSVFRMEGGVAKAGEDPVPPGVGDLVEALVDVCPAAAIQTHPE